MRRCAPWNPSPASAASTCVVGWTFHLLPTLPVHAQALAAWRLEDQWVTAVKLTNTSVRWLDLDPRALQGDFVAATFQHPNLGAGRPPTPRSFTRYPRPRPGRVAAAQARRSTRR